MELFDERDWDYRAGIIKHDGQCTWQVMILAALIPWLVACIAKAL